MEKKEKMEKKRKEEEEDEDEDEDEEEEDDLPQKRKKKKKNFWKNEGKKNVCLFVCLFVLDFSFFLFFFFPAEEKKKSKGKWGRRVEEKERPFCFFSFFSHRLCFRVEAKLLIILEKPEDL